MTEQPQDLVITYLVDPNGKTKDRSELDAALRAGYRVIEVICTAGTAGLYVTVVLTHDEFETAYGERPAD